MHLSFSKEPKLPSINIEESWRKRLIKEFEKPYMRELSAFLKMEKKEGKEIFPIGSEIFSAFNFTPFEKVKVVILGQDPYHGRGQAHGLSFSVKEGVQPPPSLENIFKELKSDIELARPKSGSLEKWAEEGVLLLNTVLTVEKSKPASHQSKGWETFTDKVLSLLNEEKSHLVYILWGKKAQEKGMFLDGDANLIIKSAHPSPYSAANGFFDSKPFSKTNKYLHDKCIPPINWEL
ncbi:MAG: uracil-DNA glycosylase [Flavobacteriaceae bacterium TMED212]|nr:uracil-DNA glycosylase [Paracoccaceae bacterium]OUW76481.1 MAG: uracil-DNA glycosylase [Flavobacteriaceae bacterium TMED212]